MAEFNSNINLRLPSQPLTTEPQQFEDLSLVYNALNQLHRGVDQFLDIPPTVKIAPHTLEVIDRGTSIDTTSDVTIPLESSSGITYGSTIVITNITASTINISAEVGVTLITAGTTISGNKQLINFGVCTVRYLGADTWVIMGAGLL